MSNINQAMSALHAVHGDVTDNRKPPTEHEKLVRNTQKWVAQTFYGTMLREMRKSPFHSNEFEGGREGEAFEEMFDQRLADHMSQSAGAPLVNSIVSRIEAKQNAGSPRQILDATSAYARAMQHDSPSKPRVVLTRPGEHKSKPPVSDVHRRPQRILPEIDHVETTH